MGRSFRLPGGLCLPVTLAGAWAGARIYIGIGEETFRKAVLILLLASGALLIAQAVLRHGGTLS